MAKSTYRNYKTFYGKTRVILALLGIIPFLLTIYLFIKGRIDLMDTATLFSGLALFSILTGFSLMRRSADQLVNLSRETAIAEAGERSEPIQIEADQELNDIANHFNSLLKKVEEANREIKEQGIQLMAYTRDPSLSHNNLREAHMEIIYRLSMAAEYRDEDTGIHLKRMSRYSAVIARQGDGT